MSRIRHYRYTGFIEDAQGVQYDITYMFSTVECNESHPYGSTTATETWNETIEDSEKFTLDDDGIERDLLEAKFPNVNFTLEVDKWSDAAEEV